MVSTGSKLWLWISMPVVIWDLTYVLFRPRSMPGGDLFWIWQLYVIYGKRDGRYVDTENDWVVAQSVGNAIEILVALVGLLFLVRRAQALTLFTASLMTFWKTVLYFLVEACSGWKYTKQSDAADFWLLFVLPSFFWLAGPLYVMYDTARLLTASSAAAAKRKSA